MTGEPIKKTVLLTSIGTASKFVICGSSNGTNEPSNVVRTSKLNRLFLYNDLKV